MDDRSEWEDFFDGHAPDYMDNVFVAATVEEVDFIIELFGLEPGARIIDVGCGTGRHSVELARRGYRMTGVDLSAGMLEKAEECAADAHEEIAGNSGSTVFAKADATTFAQDEEFVDAVGEHGMFDGAICVCEGGFGLLGSRDDVHGHDIAILTNVRTVLKPGAPFLLTALNAMKFARQFTPEDVASGRWDTETLSETHDIGAELLDTNLLVTERSFTALELRLMHGIAGLDVEHVWGGTAGNWGKRPIDLDEYEIMVVSRKPAEP